MRLLSIYIIMLFLAANAFSQDNLEKLNIIKSNFIEIINSYNGNKHLINDEQFNKIMEIIGLIFIENNNHINYRENNTIIFSEKNIIMEIKLYFYKSHSTSSFTYCKGNLLINNLSYRFYLYDNSNSTNYYEIVNNNRLV